MDSAITMLMTPLPGRRLVDGQESEDGSIIGFRKNGDEALFVSWNAEEDTEKGMQWIPVSEFSPDPEAVRPPEVTEEGEGAVPSEDQLPTEVPVKKGPFGRGVRRRPELES
jgi:hypothetical protein